MVQVLVFSQLKTDVVEDRRYTARFIGFSAKNERRLNVHSALTTKKDDFDYFRFRVTRGGTLGFAVTADPGLRVELLDKKGRTLADSTAKEGTKEYERYQNFLKSRLDLDNGDYYVRTSRTAEVAKTAKVEYFFQIANGTFTRDYDTTEGPPAIPADITKVPVNVLARQTVSALLNQSLGASLLSSNNFFSQYQEIVTSVSNAGDIFSIIKARSAGNQQLDITI